MHLHLVVWETHLALVKQKMYLDCQIPAATRDSDVISRAVDSGKYEVPIRSSYKRGKSH